jgi:hypothetical protein
MNMGQIEETQNEALARCNSITLKYGTPQSTMTRSVLRLVGRHDAPNYGCYVLTFMVPEGKRDVNIGTHFEARFTGNSEETVLKTATYVPRRANGEHYIASSYELQLRDEVANHFEIPRIIWFSTAAKKARLLLKEKLIVDTWQDFRVLEYQSHGPNGYPFKWSWPVLDWCGVGFNGIIKKFNRIEEARRSQTD